MSEDDARLVARLLSGDREAGDALFLRHSAMLRDLVRSRMGLGLQDADNVVQGVWLQLLEEDGRRLRRYDPARPLRPFLIGVALNACRDHRRREGRRRGARPLEDWMAASAPSAALESREARGILEAAFQELGPRDRMILTAVDVEGLSHAEVGGLLGVAPRSVSVLAERARERLRAALKNAGSSL